MSSLSALIEQAGLFDRDFYVASYRESLADGIDPLDHYLQTGRHKGFKPNADFDPLVYLLHRPEAKPDPLLHYLRNPATRPADLSVAAAFPEIGPPEWSILNTERGLAERDLKDNLDRSHQYSDAQTVEFALDGRHYSLVAPSADSFFAALRDDAPFAYPRLPHGFWDCLLELQNIRAKLAEAAPEGLFTPDQLDRLAERLCDEMMPALGVFAENFLAEILGGLAQEKTAPTYRRSVSFKWRPTIEDRVFGRTDTLGPAEQRQLRMFVQHFNHEPTVYESMVWKRWIYSGELKQLPGLAREHPVILVGAAGVGDLDQRWQLPWFEHVEILASSYTIRYDVLDRIKAAVLRAKAVAAEHATKRPLVILQGGSFAYWLIARLYRWDPGVFYFDLGQSLHTWFLDNEEHWTPWLTLHPRLIMVNCDLDAFYRDRGIALKPPFGAGPAIPHEGQLPVIEQSRADLLAAQESAVQQIAKLQGICDERGALIAQLDRVCNERLSLIEQLHGTCAERLGKIRELEEINLAQAEEIARFKAALLRPARK